MSSFSFVRRLGTNIIKSIECLGDATILLYYILVTPGASKNIFKEIYKLGVQSLPIIVVSGFFVGMVLGLQGYYTLTDFGAEDSIGVFVTLTLTRELAPVITAILFAGRSGSAMVTEIGLMKTTEQLAALDLMGIDPMRYVYRPRLVASVISVPALVMIFMAVGIIGAWLVSVPVLGIDDGSFWSQMQSQVSWRLDVMNGMIKSLFFGVAVSWLAVYFGHSCVPSSEGVGSATTSTVVSSSLGVLALDFVLTAVMFN